ncbi:hybrid sensor histidine kinase/response regulator [Methylobacterium isbiliense]|uniref:histidine kinase n=1 Tax=Methylobacterium isbiliense TaxID=315478 RepID=A0ABQ4SGQ7_9HYPH|nr:response regulator [Methylobacterium isbiliense]MDN3624445.1 response regulator [Methylobacterium isbiliense]GJE01675.1 Sensor histidine kinase RcsC [Methylobacterium isbiliense]
MDIRAMLLAAFEAEHREHLGAIRAALAAARAGAAPDWNDVFRRAHSLKGAARAVDLPAVEDIAHRLETLFDRIVEGAQPLDRAAEAAVTLALDRIEGMVAALAEVPEPALPQDAAAALDRCLSGSPAAAQPSAETAPAQRPAAAPRPAATEVTPAPRPAEAPHPPSAETVPAPRPAEAPRAEPAEAAPAVLRVAGEDVDRLSRAVHDLSLALQSQDEIGGAVAALESGGRALRRTADALRERAGEVSTLSRRLREAGDPGAAALDAALDLLRRLDGEVRAMVRGASGLARTQHRAAGTVEVAVRRLREDADRLLLVPAETVFGGYGRMVREIAREAGLPVEVRLEGLDRPVDRVLLQALKDPVLHLMRNAVSHGAEPPEARRARGKPEALTITLSVSLRGGDLVLSVRDDGRGPDIPRIVETARRQGLIPPEARPSTREALRLVFAPGFSTAERVDRLAGRGVGLSVVAEAVAALRGRARLRRAEPWGAEVIVTVPVSAARRPLLLVEAAGRIYALPGSATARLLRLAPSDLVPVSGLPHARVALDGREVSVPVVPLAALLGGPAALPVEDGRVRAVLVRNGADLCAVAVDRLLDVRPSLVGPPPPIGGDPGLVSGTVLLADESPALVLDPAGLVARSAEAGGRLAALPAPAARSARRRTPTILVVDDSITTRTLEKSILEAEGYRVFVCVDGQDGLDRLRRDGAQVDLVVADVEMPRLDGFGLLRAIKEDPDLTRLPVILMTSRGDPADIRRGLDLGADAYITKQKFDQRELLDTIGQLL